MKKSTKLSKFEHKYRRQRKRSRKYDILIQSRSMKKSTKLSEFEHKYQTQISDNPIFYCSSCERTIFGC